MTCGECFHGPGARSPVTPAERAHSAGSELGSYPVTPVGQTGLLCVMEKKLSFPFSPPTTGIHYVSSFSICPFIFRCLEMSGRACVCFPCRDCRSVYWWLSAGTACVLFQAVWHASCHGWPWPRVSFLRPPCFSRLMSSVCEVSLAAASNHPLISWEGLTALRLTVRPDTGHPDSGVSVRAASG